MTFISGNPKGPYRGDTGTCGAILGKVYAWVSTNKLIIYIYQIL